MNVDSERQLRVLFAGRDNPFNRGIINWLSARYSVVGALFLEINRRSIGGMMKRIRGRIRKYGIVAAGDELAFQVYDRMVNRKRDHAMWKAQFPREFIEPNEVQVPQFAVDNLHSPEWLAIVRELKPDLVFCICASVILRKEFYTIPSLGTFVLHEGITPEYRGLHTTLWSLLNKEHEYIGYTLLKIDDSIDGGPILVQGRYDLEPGEDRTKWSFVGHKAILRGLPDIESALDQLAEHRGFVPVPQAGRRSGYYTWVRLSQYLGRKQQP